MGIAQMFGRQPQAREAYPDPAPEGGHQSTGVTPPPRSASPSVNLTTAVSLVPVFRSLQILATVGGQIRLTADRGGVEMIDTPPLVAAPDVNLTPSRFKKRSIVSLGATGRCIWKKYRYADGTVSSYEVLNPLTTYRTYNAKNQPVYRTSRTVRGRSVVEEIAAADIRHLKLMEVPGFDDGLGPIQAGRISLAGAVDLRNYASGWFREGGTPNGVLSTDAQIPNGDVADQYKKRFKESVEGHDLAVLGHGLSYEPIMLNPEDAQWLQAQQFTTTEVARLFGIPASYLLAAVEGSSMTYSNLEQIDTQFVRTTLMAYLTEIEDAITSDLPGRQTARFDLSELLRPDTKTRAEVDKLYIDSKVYGPEFVRQRDRITATAPEGTPND